MRNGVRRTLFGLAGAAALASPALAQSPPSGRTARLFELVCAHCHARPGLGVPLVGDAAAWRERAARGPETMLANTVNGVGGMPPLGTCAFCSEEDLRLLIDLLAGPALAAEPPGGAGP